MNHTLTAFYGKKPIPLVKLVSQIQQLLSTTLSTSFLPYEAPQVHATLIGLETFTKEKALIHSHFSHVSGKEYPLDWGNLYHKVLAFIKQNVQIRIGGFHQEQEYGFYSRGQSPFTRSFQVIQGSAVLIGWPYWEENQTTALEDFRRSCQEACVMHKYHVGETDVDNDFFMVLGKISDGTSLDQKENISFLVRKLLADYPPTCLPISKANLSFIQYQSPELPLHSTQVADIEAIREYANDTNFTNL